MKVYVLAGIKRKRENQDEKAHLVQLCHCGNVAWHAIGQCFGGSQHI
jgi:hypothetical protein